MVSEQGVFHGVLLGDFAVAWTIYGVLIELGFQLYLMVPPSPAWSQYSVLIRPHPQAAE